VPVGLRRWQRGGGDNQVSGIDRGGITIAQGPINGFGSVIVNGVRYSTAGRPGSRSTTSRAWSRTCAWAQVVRVRGPTGCGGTTGTATTISYDDDVEGPIQSIEAGADTLVVLGQTVKVGPSTSFDDRISTRSLAGLAVATGSR